jgi:predicted DNA-binding protein
MYDTYIMRRTQIYLDEEHDRQLADRARSAGVTKSTLIREALAEYLQPASDEDARLARFRAALDEASRTPADLPPGGEYVEDLRAADRSREDALTRRRA